jgi:hypothetical protein
LNTQKQLQQEVTLTNTLKSQINDLKGVA